MTYRIEIVGNNPLPSVSALEELTREILRFLDEVQLIEDPTTKVVFSTEPWNYEVEL